MSQTAPTIEPAAAAPAGKKPRKTVLVVSVLVIVALSAALFLQSFKPQLLTGPMVQYPEFDTLTIVWEMDSALGGAIARLATSDGVLEERAVRSGNRYEASFLKLKPGTSYAYSIQQPILFFRQDVAGPFETKTPPARGRPFRFVAFGDSGNGSNTQTALADRIGAAKPDVVIHVGDLVYPSGKMADYPDNFFGPNASFIHRVPFMASLGNHDVVDDGGQALLEVFTLPRNGPAGIEPERNYYFDWGDARFVALDSNPVEEHGVITTEQRRDVIAPWLRKVLTDCDAVWKFVFYHHPFYTGSEHPAEGGKHMKDAYLKVFEECGVDMVFCGHNHLYERIAPMRGDVAVPDGKGIVYIITGAGGVSRYPEDANAPKYVTTYNSEVFSFTQVDLTADRLELRQIEETGNVLDVYTLSKLPPPK